MPGARHIQIVPNLGTPLAVGTDPATGDEAWLVDPTATAHEIVHHTSDYLAIANARCDAYQHKGQRRAIWLCLAVLAGVILPSPFRGFYDAYGWLHALQAATFAVVGTLLALALWEHLGMRRLRAES